jgi:ketosteroid isomerase-like protein
VSTENVQLARRIIDGLPLDDLAAAFRDEERIAAMAAALQPFVDPEVEIVRIGPEYTGEGVRYVGLGGFREFWTDWLEPWESLRIETEEFLDAGDRVVQLVRQSGRTRTGSIPIEGRGAAVMTFCSGKATRIEFHLDRERAMKSAGLADD